MSGQSAEVPIIGGPQDVECEGLVQAPPPMPAPSAARVWLPSALKAGGLVLVTLTAASAWLCIQPHGAGAAGSAFRGATVNLWDNEHFIGPAPPGQEAGVSLFCFMAVLPGSMETQLRERAERYHAGIYCRSCDQHKVYDAYPAPFVHQGSWNSFANTAAFVKVWEQVFADKLYTMADWTVKADPDTVFIGLRLKSHLRAIRPPANVPLYFKNSPVSFGFLGAFEVMSKAAVELLTQKYKECEQRIGDHSGEDGYIKGCFDMNGVRVMADNDLLQSSGDCWEGNKVAFHAKKTPEEWGTCLIRMAIVQRRR